MMTTQDKLDLFASALLCGNLSSEQQAMMGRDLHEIGIEHRRLQRFADETVQDAAEDARIAEANRVLPPPNLLPFPRRPMPVRLATPAVVAVEGEIWR